MCDLSDLTRVRRAAAEIVALRLPIAGLLNNPGIFQMRATRNAQGWDLTFATNHLGPFVLTDALVPHLPDGANVVFVTSGVEDPERKPGGSTLPGGDAYATSKQCALATAVEFARENPRLHIDSVEPGFTPNTGLGRDANAFLRFLTKYIIPLFAPFVKYWSTPKRAARVITKVLVNKTG